MYLFHIEDFITSYLIIKEQSYFIVSKLGMLDRQYQALFDRHKLEEMITHALWESITYKQTMTQEINSSRI